MEGFGGREGSEAVLNELIGVCDLAVYIECTGAMRQKPDDFLLDDVVKALKWRNEIDLIGIGAGLRSPLSTAQTAHLSASCLIYLYRRFYCSFYCSCFVLIGQGLCCRRAGRASYRGRG